MRVKKEILIVFKPAIDSLSVTNKETHLITEEWNSILNEIDFWLLLILWKGHLWSFSLQRIEDWLAWQVCSNVVMSSFSNNFRLFVNILKLKSVLLLPTQLTMSERNLWNQILKVGTNICCVLYCFDYMTMTHLKVYQIGPNRVNLKRNRLLVLYSLEILFGGLVVFITLNWSRFVRIYYKNSRRLLLVSRLWRLTFWWYL